MKSSLKALVAILPIAATLLMTGCSEQLANAVTSPKTQDTGSSGSSDLAPPKSDLGVTKEDLLKRLSNLKESDPGPMKGYSRDRFPHWLPTTSALGWANEVSGCNSRWAVLWYSGKNLSWDDQKNCQIIINQDGGWQDHYGVLKNAKDPNSGLKPYKFSDSAEGFDIDHIVAIADAWRSGASGWKSDDDRSNLANDPLNLSISDPSANRSKGDQGPGTYLPPGDFRCEYVQRYTLVKSKYDLTITTNDKSRLNDTINQCM